MSDVCLQVFLTPTHLAIVMEYAAGGELFGRICSAGRFSEDEVDVLPFLAFLYLFIFSISQPVFCSVSRNRSAHQARFFFQQLISGVSYCHSMV